MRKRVNPQLIIAIGVLLTSFGALFVSIRQASIMNKQTEILLQQTKSGAWPYLHISLYRGFNMQGEINTYQINVVNKGTGPAIIEGVRVLYDGKTARNWEDFYSLIQVPDSIVRAHTNSLIYNQVISANEQALLIDLSQNKPLMDWVFMHGDKFTIEICYKSVFDEYWKSERKGIKTNLEVANHEKIKGCGIESDELFME
jgi:hypothetical protein